MNKQVATAAQDQDKNLENAIEAELQALKMDLEINTYDGKLTIRAHVLKPITIRGQTSVQRTPVVVFNRFCSEEDALRMIAEHRVVRRNDNDATFYSYQYTRVVRFD